MSKQIFLRIFLIFGMALAGIELGNGAERRIPLLKHGGPLVHFVRMEASDKTSPGEGKILYYQDPMHPWYRSDKPGIAPDCGMKLVPIYASDAPAAALPPGGVEISSARQQTMGVTSPSAEENSI